MLSVLASPWLPSPILPTILLQLIPVHFAMRSCVSTKVFDTCFTSAECRLRSFQRFVFVALLMNGVRLGEALAWWCTEHPGPVTDSPGDPDSFCIGCFNPTGLAGKAAVINEYLAWGDVWSIAETHQHIRLVRMFIIGRCRRSAEVLRSPSHRSATLPLGFQSQYASTPRAQAHGREWQCLP